MDADSVLSSLLGLAVILPLLAFAVIVVGYSVVQFARRPISAAAAKVAAYISCGAILIGFFCSLVVLGIWLNVNPLTGSDATADHAAATDIDASTSQTVLTSSSSAPEESEHAVDSHHANPPPKYYAGDWYTLGEFGKLKLSIGYHIDALTVVMFCMVTLVASCVHIYSIGYMHDELAAEWTDPEVTLENGEALKRAGRFFRFFQYLSLFSFSMLGLVVAGNMAMVFVFWELVGICSYFLIGFYIERKSASNAANKAFIVNRIGDFGMLIGMMALWASLGTFVFGDVELDKRYPEKALGKEVVFHNGKELGRVVEVISDEQKQLSQVVVQPHAIGAEPLLLDVESDGVKEAGVFIRVRQAENAYQLEPADGMVKLAARDEVAGIVRTAHAVGPDGVAKDEAAIEAEIEENIDAKIDTWRDDPEHKYGHWLLFIAGVGIFCGCVGKRAQFPLHVWLPDAMEGPTPVSALVHSATMVAAGVYLVGRFYPVFSPEALLVIAYTGCITLFLAATIAITATDIKRVLAYSTVSQLGYMMLALGVGGWIAGLFHLITHAFFKGLLFLCSGSVIHAVHSNEMTEMGGLRKKMPITAYTMLIGCLAIIGVGVPFVIGLSGYYSKDAILEQAYLFMEKNPAHSTLFWAAAGGAAITAFYMFRLWYMTFAGKPKNQHRYDHAHESPKTMTVPLIVLAVFAVIIGGTLPGTNFGVAEMLKQAQPVGTAVTSHGELMHLTIPSEHGRHADEIVGPVTMFAFSTALAGFLLATIMYAWRKLDPDEVRLQFRSAHKFLLNKWWFDELYDFLFVRPAHVISRWIARFDLGIIDWFVDHAAKACCGIAALWDLIVDQGVVDGSLNVSARKTWSLGLSLRRIQTGSLRQYIMFIALGTVALFLLITFVWRAAIAG